MFNPPINIFRSKLSKKGNTVVPLLLRVILISFSFLLTSFSLPVVKAPAANPYAITCVVIDAGHGGHDSGCLGEKTKEKDIALGVSLKLGKYIEDTYKDVKVIYTRTTDKFVELHQRATIANNAKANLFICIHCNSACVYDKKHKKDICNGDIHGTEVWVMGLKKADENLQVAKRENDVVLMEKDYQKQYDGFDPNSPQANIIFTLYQNAYLDQSLRIASYVEDAVQKNAKREGRGVKQAGFLVLYKTTMPSLLIETGFLTNKEEENFLGSTAGQDKMALSIFSAFKNYKQNVENGHKEVKPNPEETVNEVKDSDRTDTDTEQPVEVKHVENLPKENKPVTHVKEPTKPKELPVNTNNGSEIYFSVQFVTSSTLLSKSSAKLKGAQDFRVEQADGLYKYVSGHESSMEQAVHLQNDMRVKGFKDAFAVAYQGGKRISIKEATGILKNNIDYC